MGVIDARPYCQSCARAMKVGPTCNYSESICVNTLASLA